MTNNDDSVWALILGGGLAYLLMQNKDQSWNAFKDNYKKRIERLSHDRIRPPLNYFNQDPNMSSVYRESIFCYLFGLPNSCIPSLVRVLEQSLKTYYHYEEGKKAKDIDLNGLINWAEKFLKSKANTAHNFRMLRNYVHTDILIDERDCPEAIRHVSSVINNLFGESVRDLQTACSYCKHTQSTTFNDVSDIFIGNTESVKCGNCSRVYNWIIMP